MPFRSLRPAVKEMVPVPEKDDPKSSVWLPPPKLSAPPEVGLKAPELLPPLLRPMVPVDAEMVPLLFKATRKLARPVPAVLVSVLVLLKVEPTPPLLVQT